MGQIGYFQMEGIRSFFRRTSRRKWSASKRKRQWTKQVYSERKQKNYGFNLTLGDPRELYFCEAPIDRLSYWSTHKVLNNVRFICLEGLKPQTVVHFVQETYQHFDRLPRRRNYCVDNDSAGHRFFDKCNKELNFKKKKTSE